MAPTFALFMLLMSAAIGSAQNNYYYEPSTSSFSPAFWTVTTRLIDSYTQELYTYNNGEVSTESYLITRTIKSDVTPTASATFTTTFSEFYNDVEQVWLYYPTGAVGESDFAPETTRIYGLSTTGSLAASTTTAYEYFMPVTMTAPTSCPTPFTVTSVASVDIPRAARALVTASSVATGSTASDRYGDTTVSETWYLSGGSAPYPTSNDYNYYAYIEECSTPPLPYKTASPTATSGTGGGLYYDPNDDNDSDSNNYSSSSGSDECYYYYPGCGLSIIEIIIIVVSVIGGLFLLGFLESWFWFRRLMLGRTAMRLGTVCWILITLLMMCATRIQDRRTKEDQVLLTERWKEMKAGAKFRAWLRYGFRHRYPEELLGQFSRMTVGIVPPGEPLHPAMEQPPQGFLPASQVYYYGPQWARGPNGEPLPPQGYIVPAGQHAGYYGGEMAKPGVLGMVVSNVPMYPQRPQPAYAMPRGAVNTTGPFSISGNSGPSSATENALPPLPPRPDNTTPQAESSIPDLPPQAPTSAPPPPPIIAPVAPVAEDKHNAPISAPPPPPVANAETSETAHTQETPQAVNTLKDPPASSAPDHSETSAPQSAPQLPPIDLSDPAATKASKSPEQPAGLPPPKGDADNKSLYG